MCSWNDSIVSQGIVHPKMSVRSIIRSPNEDRMMEKIRELYFNAFVFTCKTFPSERRTSDGNNKRLRKTLWLLWTKWVQCWTQNALKYEFFEHFNKLILLLNTQKETFGIMYFLFLKQLQWCTYVSIIQYISSVPYLKYECLIWTFIKSTDLDWMIFSSSTHWLKFQSVHINLAYFEIV